MILDANILITENYKGKTKHSFFHNLQSGDRVTIFTEIKTIRRNVHSFGLEATKVTFRNNRNGEEFTTTMGLTNKYLDILKYSIM